MNKNVQDSNLKLEIKQEDEGKWRKHSLKKIIILMQKHYNVKS